MSTYIEVPFEAGERTIYPDGLLQTTRGTKTWTCLLEVKTGSCVLERPQVEAYLDVARENGFDAVLTISNQIAPAPDIHPVDVDGRKTKKVALHHLSWAEVLTTAVQHRVHRGVSDPDQAWILGELIRYLEHPKSGALDFSDMGASWVPVREAMAAGTLRASDKGLADVTSRWEQLVRFAALRLGRELGADAQVQLSRRELADPSLRFASQTQSLVSHGVLGGSLRVPDAVAPIDVLADLRAGRVVVSVDIDAPREGRAATRVNWLVRQLREAPENLRIDAFTAGSRTSTSELLRLVRGDPAVLIADPRREFRSFRVAASSPLGSKRTVGRGGFIDSVLAAIDGFYGAVVQQLRPWSTKAPQLPRAAMTAVEEAGIDVQPPPRDLVEDTEPALDHPPPETIEPHVVREGVDHAELGSDEAVHDTPGHGDHVGPAELAPEPADELVSWQVAHERLDREREVADAGAQDDAERS